MWAIMLMSVLSYGLTACIIGPGSLQGENSKQASAEYKREELSLSLPPGSGWPKVPEQATGPDGRPQRYEPGAARDDADFRWLCAWTRYLDQQASRSRLALVAASNIQYLRRTYLYMSGADEPTRLSLDTLLKSVVGGVKSSALRQFVSTGCSNIDPVAASSSQARD
jgi:hypothetical protein